MYLMHHGVKGMKWGVRRYQNPDGTLTPEGRIKYLKQYTDENGTVHTELTKAGNKAFKKNQRKRQSKVYSDDAIKWEQLNNEQIRKRLTKGKSPTLSEMENALGDRLESLWNSGCMFTEQYESTRLAHIDVVKARQIKQQIDELSWRMSSGRFNKDYEDTTNRYVFGGKRNN